MNEELKYAVRKTLEFVKGIDFLSEKGRQVFGELEKAFSVANKKTTPEIRADFLRQCCVNHTENDDNFSLEVLRKTGEHYLLCKVEGRQKGFLLIPRFNDCHEEQEEHIVATVLDVKGNFITVFHDSIVSDKGAIQTAKNWLVEGWGDDEDEEKATTDYGL